MIVEGRGLRRVCLLLIFALLLVPILSSTTTWKTPASAHIGRNSHHTEVVAYAARTATTTRPTHRELTSILSIAAADYIESPANGSTVRGKTTITFTVSSIGALVRSVRLKIDSTTVKYVSRNGEYSYVWETWEWGDGWHTAVLEAYDSVTRTWYEEDRKLYYVDNRGEITSPADGSLLRGTVAVRFTVSLGAYEKATLYVDGTSVRTVLSSGTYTWYWDTTGYSDGSHTVTLKITNNLVGATWIADRKTYEVDNTAPSVEITAPANNTYHNTDSITITISWGDDNPDRCELWIDGTQVKTWTTTGTVSYSWSGPSEGERMIEVIAYDDAGNSAEYPIRIFVDRSSPTVNIVRPTDGSYLRGSVAVDVYWNDNLYPLKCVLYINGSSVATWWGTGTKTYLWDTTNWDDGTYIIEAIAYDKAGNKGYANITVHVDNTKPYVSIGGVVDGEVLGGTRIIRVFWSDANPDVCRLYINGTLVNSSSADLTYVWDTTGWGDGVYNITAFALDLAGNGRSVTVWVTVDNTAPRILEVLIDGFDVTDMLFDGDTYYVVVPLGFVWSLTFVVSDPHFNPAASYLYLNSSVLSNLTDLVFSANRTVFLFGGAGAGFAAVSVCLVDSVGNIFNETLNFVFHVFSPDYEFAFELRGEYGERAGGSSGYYNDSGQSIDISIWWDERSFYPLWGAELYSNGTQIERFGERTYGIVGNGSVVAILKADRFQHYRRIREISETIILEQIVAVFGGAEGYYCLFIRAYYTPKHYAVSNETYIVFDTAPPDIQFGFGEPYYFDGSTYVVSLNSTYLSISGDDNVDHSHYRVWIYASYREITYMMYETGAAELNMSFLLNFSGCSGLWNRNITLHIRIEDPCGNRLCVEAPIYVDTQPPEIQVWSSVANDTATNSNVTVRWAVSDVCPVNVSVLLFGPVEMASSSAVGNFSVGGEGYYEFVVYACDVMGNASTYVLVFWIDKSPPEIYFGNPYGDETWTSNRAMNISFCVSDNFGSLAVNLTIRNSEGALIDSYFWVADECTLEGSVLYVFPGDGLYVIMLYASDSAGNMNVATQYVYVDTEPPRVRVYSPQNSTYYGSAEIAIDLEIYDENLGGYLILLDGDELSGTISNGTVKILIDADLGDGEHILYVYAGDRARNHVELRIIFYVDTEAPQITIISPIHGHYYNSSEIAVNIGIYDPNLAEYAVCINGTPLGDLNAVVYLENGAYILLVSATDRAGNRNETKITFYVDTEPPTISISSPIHNATYSSSISVNAGLFSLDNMTFSWAVEDKYIDVVLVGVSGPTYVESTDVCGSFFLLLDDGVYVVTIYASDRAGNSVCVVLSFEVDVSVPTAYFVEPNNNLTWVSAGVSVNFSFCVCDPNLWSVSLRVNGSLVYYYEGSNDSVRSSTVCRFGGDGLYVVSLCAEDLAGNSVEMTYCVYVDSAAPEIIVYSPVPNATYGPNITLNITIWDLFLDECYVYLDGEPLDNLTMNITLGTGIHTLYVYARDKSGNVAEASINFYVDADPPEPVLFLDNVTNDTILGWEPENLTIEINESCYLRVYVNGELIYEEDITEPENITISMVLMNVTLSEGEHQIVVEVVDPYGNHAAYVYHIIIDRTPPKIAVHSISREIPPNATVEVVVHEEYLENVTVYVDNRTYAVLTGNETLELILDEGTHTLRFVAYDLAGNRAEKKYKVRVIISGEKEEEEKIPEAKPYPEEPNTETPQIRKKEQRLFELRDPLAWLSATLITISFIATGIAVIVRGKSRKMAGLLLALGMATGIHMFLTWSIVGENGGDEGKIAEAVRRNGTLTILSSEGEIVKAGSAPGILSSLKLGNEEDYPTDPSLLHPVSLRAKHHISRSGLVVWSPGVRVSNDTSAKYILDMLYQFAFTTFEHSTFLFGDYATARNLMLALAKAEYVVIITHATGNGILTKDAGGFLLNATVMEKLIGETIRRYGGIGAHVIAIYCDAPTHPITELLSKHTTVYPAERTESGLDILNSLIELLFCGYWVLERRREVRGVLLDGKDFTMVYEMEDRLINISLPMGSNQSIRLLKVERKERIYLVDPSRNITINYGTAYDRVKFVDTLSDERNTQRVRVPGPIMWVHKPFAFGRVKVFGDLIYGVDFGGDAARIVGWLQRNIGLARKYYEIVTQSGNHTVGEVREAIRFLEKAERKLGALANIQRNAEGDDKREVGYIIRNAMPIILKYRIWIARVLRTKPYIDAAESLISQIEFILKDKSEILNAVTRLRNGTYEDPQLLARDIRLLGLGFRISIRALQYSVKARIVGAMIPGLRRYLEAYISKLDELAELRGSLGLMVRARLLQSSLGAVNLVRLIVENLRESWNETAALFERIRAGDYNVSLDISRVVEEDVRRAEEIMGTLRLLYTLTFKIAVLRGFYPAYRDLYEEARGYASKYFEFLGYMRHAENILRIAGIIQRILEENQKFSELTNNINTTRLMDLYNAINITFVETNTTDPSKPPVEIMCSENSTGIFAEMINYAELMEKKLAIAIRIYNDITALRYTLRPFQRYLLAQRLSVAPNTTILGTLTEYISTADDLIELASIQIELAEKHMRGIQAVNRTEEALDELLGFDTYNLTEAQRKVEELEDDVREGISEIIRIQGAMINIRSSLTPLIYMPSYGYGELIREKARETKEYASRLADWYHMQYARLNTLLRAALLHNEYAYSIVPAFNQTWILAIHQPKNLTLDDVEYWIGFADNLTSQIIAVNEEINAVLTEARGEDYEEEVCDYLSWRYELYEMLMVTSWVYNVYTKIGRLIRYLLQANETAARAISVEGEIIGYIGNTTDTILSGEYDYLAWEETINVTWGGKSWERRYVDAASPLIPLLLSIGRTYSQIYGSKHETHLALNETAEGYKSLFYTAENTTTLTTSRILLAIRGYLSIVYDYAEPTAEPKYNAITSRILENLEHSDEIAGCIEKTLTATLYHRLEETLYEEVKSILAEEPDTWSIGIIEYAYEKLRKLIPTHRETEIPDSTPLLAEIAAFSMGIHEEAEKLSRSRIIDVAHRVVAAWENIAFVEEEVDEEGGIAYYRAVRGENAEWKLVRIIPRGEPLETLLRAEYRELLSRDADTVRFLDPGTAEETIERLEYLVMLYEEASIPKETIGIGEIDRILGMHYEALEAKRGALSLWYKHAKEALKHKSELLKDIELEDPSEMEIGAKSTLGAFTFIDELVNKIAKGAMDFVMWVKQRLDEFFWWVPWPFHDPLVNAILAVVAAPVAQFVFIIKSDVGKMILSGVYMLIQMGADIIQIVAAGLAWLIMKAIEFLAWLLGNIISVVVDFLGVPDPARSIIKDVLCGTLQQVADWAGQQALYMEHIVAERLEHLAEVALSFLGPIVGPVAMIVDAVRELFGSFLMDWYLMFAVPAIYNAYGGNMTAAKYDMVFRRDVFNRRVSSALLGSGFTWGLIKGLGRLAYTVLPSSEKAEIVVSCLGIINEVLSAELARVGVGEQASAQMTSSGEDLGSGEVLLSGEEARERVAKASVALDGVDYVFRIESISVPVRIGRVDRTLFPASGLISFAKDGVWRGYGLRNWVLAIVENALGCDIDEFLGMVDSGFGDADLSVIRDYFEKLANYIVAVVNSYPDKFQVYAEESSECLADLILGYVDILRDYVRNSIIDEGFDKSVENMFAPFESDVLIDHVEVMLKVLAVVANLYTKASEMIEIFRNEENDATLRAGAYLLVRTLVNYLRTLNHIEIGGNYYGIDELYYEDSQGTLRLNEQVVAKEDLERSLHPKAYVWRVDRRSVEGEIERSTENSILAAAEILAFEVPAHSDVHTLRGLQTAKTEQIPLTDLLVNMREGTVIPIADGHGRLERIIILYRGDKGYECIVWNGNLRINMLATLRTRDGNIVTWPVFLHIDVFGAYRERKTEGESRASKFPGIDICLPYRQSILVGITSPGNIEIEVKVSGDLASNPDVSVDTKNLEQYFRDFVTGWSKDDVKKAFKRLWELGIIKISSNVDAGIDDIFEIVWDKIKNNDDKCRTIVALAKFYSQFPDRSSIERFSREYIESKKLASLVGEFLKQYMVGYLADLGESEKEALVRRTEKILEIFAKIPDDILDRILSDAAASGELSDDTKRFIGLLKEHRDDIGSLAEKLTSRDFLEYLVGLERYRREIYKALGKINAKKEYINIVRALRHRIKELIGESVISLYPVGLYKLGEKENILSEIAPQALTQFTSLVSQLVAHSKLVYFDTTKKHLSSGRNIIRIATNLLGSGKTALAAAYLRAYIWLISRLGDSVGHGRNVYSIVREYICGNRDILREYGDKISEEEVKTLAAILRELFPNADFTKNRLKKLSRFLEGFITGKWIGFKDMLRVAYDAIEELEAGKTEGKNLEEVKAWRSIGPAIRTLLGKFPKTPPNISPTLLQRALSIFESYYSPATRILSSMIFVRPEAVGLATNLLALIRECGKIEVDIDLAGNQRNSVEKIVRHLVYNCGDPRDALRILEDTLEEIGEEELSEYERMAIGNLRLNIRELRVLSGETVDVVWTQTRTLLKTILLLEASMKALTKGMSLSKTKLTENGEIINTNNQAESIEAELTKNLEILTLSGQGGVQITENPNSREIKIRIRSPAMKHLKQSTTENRESGEATTHRNEIEATLRYVEEEPGRGWVMVFMRDPTTDLAERYTIENLVRSGGNMEKTANSILPVFGGYIVRVINGEPCQTTYRSRVGVGKILMRPIVFHDLETLALYYMSRKTAPYEDLVSTLTEIEELLEEGKIGEAQESIEDLNDALDRIRGTRVFGLPQMLGEYVKRSIIAQTEKIIERLKTGKNPLNEVRRLISGVRILREKLRGETDKVLEKIEIIMNPQRGDPAKALRELIAMIDDPQQEDEQTEAGTEAEAGAEEAENILTGAYAYVRYLEETRPELLQTKPRIPLREDLANQIRTGLIVGLMTTLGAVIGTVVLEATGGEDSPILDMLNFEAPTLIWIVLGAALALITLYMLSRDEAIRNTDRKLTDVFLRYGKKVAISVVLGASIWTYAKQHRKEILSKIPLFVPLSGILWVWDEFDDFQDGVSRLKNTGSWKGGGLSDPFELWVLPLILGMFAVWFGVDEYKVMARIPGRWGFAKYVATINIPAPWDMVVYAIYSILSFMIGNVAASGVRGVGWVFYTAASVVGSLIMESILREALALIL